MRLTPSIGFLVLGAALALGATAQTPANATLPRRIQFGASLASVTDSLRTLGAPPGARVLAVLPQTPAADAGMQPQDVIVRIGHDTVTDVPSALAVLRVIPSGTHVPVGVVRAGAARSITFVARERPRETSADFDVVYTAVAAPGGVRRVLVTHPHAGGPHPTVMLVGGIGCYSIDQPTGENPYRDLMYHLTRRGYTTVRVEKAGVGDSEGGPCMATDLDTEVGGYRAALSAARHLPWVDSSRVFLFGHSIGGIEGPLLAGSDSLALAPLRGVAVLSTVGINWYEYELANLRRQLRLQNLPPDSIEIVMARKARCGFHFLVERQSRAAVLAAEPGCLPSVSYPASETYMQQVAAINVATTWKKVAVPALVMHGGSDFVTSRDEHLELVEAINAMHPGNATYADVPELDHYLSHQATPLASFSDPVPGLSRKYDGTHLEPILDAWLDGLAPLALRR